MSYIRALVSSIVSRVS